MSLEFPVPTVRLIVKNADNEVLILRRPAHSHGAGGWCLPGGKVDFGDTVEHTVAKELHEETNLRCTNLRFLFYQDSLPSEESEMHVVNLYFECEGEGTLRLNDESAESAWIANAEMSHFRFVFNNEKGLREYFETSEDTGTDEIGANRPCHRS